jgi:hypothetical protein
MPASNTTLRPVFTLNSTYSLTIEQSVGGTTNISGGNYTANQSVILIATPSNDYAFSKWQQLILGVWTDFNTLSSFVLQMPASNTTLRPIFIEEVTPPDTDPPISTGDLLFARTD